MRVFCAVHQHLGLVAALRRYPELRGEPVIVGGAPELRLSVVAASAPAVAAGVRPGMPLRQAQQVCAQAAFVPLDAEAVASLRAGAEAAVHRLSPVVESGDAELLCDLSGSHAQHPTEAAWAAAVARSLQAVLGTDPIAAGVAGSRFTARMAARRSDPSRIRRVPPGEEAAFLASLPLGVLPVPEAVSGRLAALGLDCLGAVAAIAPADLQRQFGTEGLRLSCLVRGGDGEQLHPEPAVRVLEERLVLDGPVGDLEMLASAARQCATALGRRLVEATLAATRIGVSFEV
ncbi:MAG: hypothetical protein JOZ92_05205, partial [Candidatus Dormibacteraeota bacterium]|nr:hypothetical protein [Candidatus Dormibacteraeota bacterium]